MMMTSHQHRSRNHDSSGVLEPESSSEPEETEIQPVILPEAETNTPGYKNNQLQRQPLRHRPRQEITRSRHNKDYVKKILSEDDSSSDSDYGDVMSDNIHTPIKSRQFLSRYSSLVTDDSRSCKPCSCSIYSYSYIANYS